MYVSSSNPVTPDIFQLADQNKGLDEAARAQASHPLNADITGGMNSLFVLTLWRLRAGCKSCLIMGSLSQPNQLLCCSLLLYLAWKLSRLESWLFQMLLDTGPYLPKSVYLL